MRAPPRWPLSWSLSASGAVTRRPWIWLCACVRALTAERRATVSMRIASTGPLVGFGHRAGVAGEGGARRGFGVDGVGLAALAAGLAVRAVHLDHLDARRGEVASQAGAVAAGAFDADTAHGAPGGQPGGQLAVAGGVRRERRRRQQRPGGINSSGDMDITVGIDPADDFNSVLGHNGAALLGQPTDTGHHRPGRRTGHSRCWTQGS